MTRRYRPPYLLDTTAFGVVLFVILAALLASTLLVIGDELEGDSTAKRFAPSETTST